MKGNSDESILITCCKCSKLKSQNDFYSNKSKKSGLDSLCKECSNYARGNRRKKNIGKRRKKGSGNSVVDLSEVKYNEIYVGDGAYSQNEIISEFIEKILCL